MTRRATVRTTAPALIRLGFALALLLAIALIAVLPTLPSEVRGVDASPEQFSGERAFARLRRLLDDGRPHPTGSAANRALRERLEAELRALGLTPIVQRGMACGQYGICAEVENVIAELVGRVRVPAVALASHYDSVAAGPGAGDDGAGVVSILEIARALRARGELERSVWLVFTDGEEMGLLGARLLVQDREFVKKLGALVNLEARGVSGPSLMFETSTPNDGLIGALQRSVRRPVTGSAFYSVYKRLPNDTDLTIFRNAGIAGVNFAFIGGTAHYHTPGDNLERLSPASVQHQGEQALELVRELVARGVPELRHDAVFFDLFGRLVISLPVPVFRWFALLLLVAGGACWGLCYRRDRAAGAGAGFAAAAVFGCVLIAALLGVVLDAVLRLRGSLDQPWPENRLAIAIAAVFAAVLALATSAFALGHRCTRHSMILGSWLVSLGLSAVTAWLQPELSYPFALPALTTSALVAFSWKLGKRSLELGAFGMLAANTLIWAPVSILAFDAIGVAAPALPAVLAALIVLPLLPFVVELPARTRRAATIAAAAAASIAAGVACIGEARSKDAPARVNLAHHVSANDASARWLLEAARVPKELANQGFRSNRGDDFPWFGATLVAHYELDAPWLSRPEPAIELSQETQGPEGRELVVKLRPGQPDALALELGMPRALVSGVRVDGVAVTPVALGARALIGIVAPGDRGVSVRLLVRGRSPIELRLAELVSGLPVEAKRLVELRDRNSTQSQTGDLSIVSRDLRL